MSLGGANISVLNLDGLFVNGVPVQGGAGGGGIGLGVNSSNASIAGNVYLNNSSNTQWGKVSSNINSVFIAPNTTSNVAPPLGSDGINYINTPDGQYNTGDIQLIGDSNIGITSTGSGDISFALLNNGVSDIVFPDSTTGSNVALRGSVGLSSRNSNLTFAQNPSGTIELTVATPSGSGINVDLAGSNVVPGATGLNFVDGAGIAFAITDISGVAQITATGAGGGGGISVITPPSGVPLTSSNITFTQGAGVAFSGATASSASISNTGVLALTDATGSGSSNLTGAIKLQTATPSNLTFGFNQTSNILTLNVPSQGVNILTPPTGTPVNASNATLAVAPGSGLSIVGAGSNTLTFGYTPPGGTGVLSLNGLSGAVSLTGTGIGITPGTSNIALSNTGVVSFNGITGATGITPGTGISGVVAGSNYQIANTGVVSITDSAGSNALSGAVKVIGGSGIGAVFNTGANSLTLNATGTAGVASLAGTSGGAVSGAVSLTGTTQAIPLPTATNAILTTSAGSNVSITNNGILSLTDASATTTNTLTGNVKVIGGSGINLGFNQGSNALTITSTASGGGIGVAGGTFPLSNAGFTGSVMTINTSNLVTRTGTLPATLNPGFLMMLQPGRISSSTLSGSPFFSTPANDVAITTASGQLSIYYTGSSNAIQNYPYMAWQLISN